MYVLAILASPSSVLVADFPPLDASRQLGSPIQVKAGDSRDPARQCPAGWTRSVLSVDLCIEIGGREHHREVSRRVRA